MNKYRPQPDFLKLKLSEKTLLSFIAPDHSTRSERAMAASVPVAINYILKRYYSPHFSPTLLGDVLLPHSYHLDLHIKPEETDRLAELFMVRGYRLGEFHEQWRDIVRIRADFKRANYYAPREELLGIKGEVVEIASEQLSLRP